MIELIESLYNKRKDVVLREVTNYIDDITGNAELFAKYIVGNLPDTDLNIDEVTMRDYVEHSVWLYENRMWEEIPLDIFLNYVVHPRSSKEKVEPCRNFLYNEVKDLIDESKLRTVLDVNYWCAAHVRYQLTDPRTKSAYFSYISGSGRCGEKATFLVQVYRSLGIPARSTYVPMWTHVDDNHAWVEIYIDGEWKYIGAGEGEEMLEKAWFSLATTRASYLLSNVSSWIKNDETYLEDKNLWKIVDHTSHYTSTKTIEITSDIEGLEEVTIAVLNYGSFRPLTKLKLVDGKASVSFGAGDIMLKALLNGRPIMRVIKAEETKVHLTDKDFITDKFVLTQQPGPAGKPKVYEETEEMRVYKEEQRKRRQAEYADKMKRVNEQGLHHEAHKVLKDHFKDEYENIINALKPKDLQDIDPQLLIDHVEVVKQYKDSLDSEIYYEYLSTPRVHWEELTYYTDKFNKEFGSKQEWKDNPRLINTWVESHLSSSSEYAITNTYMPVDRMIDYPYGSAIDGKILVVSIAKSIGIPARYNAFKDDIEYYDGKDFVSFSETKKRHNLTIKGILPSINVSVNPVPEPSSFSVNTIKPEEGTEFVDAFNEGLYEIIVAQRLPSGTQHAIVYPVNLDQDTTITVEVPEIKFEDVIDHTEIQDVLHNIGIEANKGILIIGDAIEEPTAHALNESIDRAESINKAGITVFFVDKNVGGGAELVEKTRNAIDNFVVLENVRKDFEDALIRRVFREPGVYPFTSIFTNGKSRISNSGYRVGSIDNDWLTTIFERSEEK